jgi:hypothetical protein
LKQIPKAIAGVAVLGTAILFSLACAGTKATVGTNNVQTPVNPNGELHYQVPEGWVTEKPSSSMRFAQFKLPRADGDEEDASLVVFFFGANQGGSVSDNIDRWVGQMQQADGSSSKDKARTETLTVNGLKVTTVDVSGTYTAQMSPGSEKHFNSGNYRLRAAIIETPRGNYFAKLIGPTKTVGHWEQAFVDYVKSFELK